MAAASAAGLPSPGVSGDAPPEAFTCSLTLEVMKDPVTAADGHSYENEAITTWLKSSSLSPLTGQPLPNRTLVKNHALRNAIQEHEASQAARQRERARMPSAGLKVILLGDSNVGKTSLVHRVKEGNFSAATQVTIGCSFCTHTAELPSGSKLALAIWDTAGHEKYRTFTRQYFRGALACALLFDMTVRASFLGAQRWLRELKVELAPPPATVIVLVGAKSDLRASRQVSEAEAREYAAAEKLEYLEASAKDGTNVEQTFVAIAEALVARGLASAEAAPAPVMVSTPPTPPPSGCC